MKNLTKILAQKSFKNLVEETHVPRARFRLSGTAAGNGASSLCRREEWTSPLYRSSFAVRSGSDRILVCAF